MKTNMLTCLAFIFLFSTMGIATSAYARERATCIETTKSCLKELRNGQNYHCGWMIRDKAKDCDLNLEKDVGISNSELQNLYQKACMTEARQILKGFENPDLYDEDEDFGFGLLMECLDTCGLFLRDVIENKSELEKFRQRIKKDEFIERVNPSRAESERWRKLLFE